MRVRFQAVSAGLGLAALLAAWILSSPPNSAPDEASHLIRGVTAAQGQWLGRDASDHYGDKDLFAVYGRSFRSTAPDRVADVYPCFAFRSAVTPSCGSPFQNDVDPRVYSHTGSYYPLVYLPLGAAEITARSPGEAVYRGRTVAALINWTLLMLAFLAVPGRLGRLGWLVALAPIDLYAASSAATNGIEICGALAFVAGALGCASADLRARRVSTVSWLAGGLFLASSKELGPVFLAALSLVLVTLFGFRRWVPQLGPKRAGAWGPLAAAAAANLLWSLLFSTNPTGFARPSIASQLAPAVRHDFRLPKNFYEAFGWLDTPTPYHFWVVGLAGFVLFLVGGARHGDTRSRLALALAVSGVIVAALAISVVEMRGGFGLQSRYIAALVSPLALFAAARARSSFAPASRAVPTAAALGAVSANVVALYGNLRRYVVGTAGSHLLRGATWSPPGGILSCVALIGIGGVVLVACAVTGAREPGAPSNRAT